MEIQKKILIATVTLWLFCFSACSSLEISTFEQLEKSPAGQCVESSVEKIILLFGGSKSTRDICSTPNTSQPKK